MRKMPIFTCLAKKINLSSYINIKIIIKDFIYVNETMRPENYQKIDKYFVYFDTKLNSPLKNNNFKQTNIP